MPERAEPLLHVVLVRPEIPNNAGNIGRTCMATSCALHLVHPLAFDTDDKAVKRAGMDYWHNLDVREHVNLDDYQRAHADARTWLTTGLPGLGKAHWNAEFQRGDHVLLGTESAGLPEDLLRAHQERVLRLPMAPGVRGMNVASTAAVLIYEALRQIDAREGLVDDSATIDCPTPVSGVWRSRNDEDGA